MSVSQHISTYGWDYAKGMVGDNPESDLIFMIKLKEYVKAYELVESYGGIDEAPYEVYLETGDDCYYNKELEEAIKLVEECL